MEDKNASINELDLGLKTSAALKAAGYNTISDLLCQSQDAWASILSDRQIADIRSAITTWQLGKSVISQTCAVEAQVGMEASDEPDDIHSLPLKRNLKKRLVKRGYVKIAQLERDLPKLTSMGVSQPVVNKIKSSISAWNRKQSIDPWDDIFSLDITTNLKNHLSKLGYAQISVLVGDFNKLSSLGVSPNRMHKLRLALVAWSSDEKAGQLLLESGLSIDDIALVPFLPSKSIEEYEDAVELIDCLVNEAIQSFDERTKQVLAERAFATDLENYPTLQELADRFCVTRERIRQIEKNGLVRARALIIECREMRGGNLSPRPELKGFWRPFLSKLEDLEEISMKELASLLIETLDIPPEQHVRILGWLSPLLTLSVTDPLSKQARSAVQHGSIGEMLGELRALPVTHLRLGRSTDGLVQKEIRTIEDFYVFCQTGTNFSQKHKTAYRALRSLVDEGVGGLEDPAKGLSIALGLHVDEFACQPGIAGAFTEFIPWFSGVIERAFSWKNLEEVFRLRTSLPANQRMKMQALSEKIWGPEAAASQVGRIERYILDNMTTAFVHKDLSGCSIHIPSEVNELMDALKNMFADAEGSYELFATIVSHRLDLPESQVKKSAHLYWAIYSGNLPDRYWHLRSENREEDKLKMSEPPQADRVIKLKGFRKTY